MSVSLRGGEFEVMAVRHRIAQIPDKITGMIPYDASLEQGEVYCMLGVPIDDISWEAPKGYKAVEKYHPSLLKQEIGTFIRRINRSYLKEVVIVVSLQDVPLVDYLQAEIGHAGDWTDHAGLPTWVMEVRRSHFPSFEAFAARVEAAIMGARGAVHRALKARLKGKKPIARSPEVAEREFKRLIVWHASGIFPMTDEDGDALRARPVAQLDALGKLVRWLDAKSEQGITEDSKLNFEKSGIIGVIAKFFEKNKRTPTVLAFLVYPDGRVEDLGQPKS